MGVLPATGAHLSGSTRPRAVEEVLSSLPDKLDDTYARMLNRIRPSAKEDALTLLRWLAYSMKPLTLAELRTIVTIRPEDNEVDFEDEGGLRDT